MDHAEIAAYMGDVLGSLLDVNPEEDGVDNALVQDCIVDALTVMRASLRKLVNETAMPKFPK